MYLKKAGLGSRNIVTYKKSFYVGSTSASIFSRNRGTVRKARLKLNNLSPKRIVTKPIFYKERLNVINTLFKIDYSRITEVSYKIPA